MNKIISIQFSNDTSDDTIKRVETFLDFILNEEGWELNIEWDNENKIWREYNILGEIK